jgi:fumarate reductase flavoprotein subunit
MKRSSDVLWDEERDVIVIGGGGGGMAAAISAAETAPEADVALLQKIDSLGGSTTMAVGSFAAAGTDLQKQAGIRDTPAAHFEDLGKQVETYASGTGRTYYFDYSGDLLEKDNLELRQLLVNEASTTLHWLRELGCEYSDPYPDPPHRVPRIHMITPSTEAYSRILGDAMAEKNVDLLLKTAARELVADAEGVCGVIADQNGRTSSLSIRAHRGVILATGDYINNEDLRERFTSNATAPPVNEHNTGDGFLMAKEAGAQWLNMDIQRLTLRFSEPLWSTPRISALVDEGAAIVNHDGTRFVNEVIDYDQLFSSTVRQPNQQMYILFDKSVADRFSDWPCRISTWPETGWGYISEYRDTDYLRKCDTLDEIGTSLGTDSGVVSETVNQFNAAVRGDRIDQYGRTNFGDPLESPYYLLGPIRPYSTITEGGVKVDTAMRVIGDDEEPITGLYAAGTLAGELHLVGHGHHHSWIFTSGRIAGQQAAKNV